MIKKDKVLFTCLEEDLGVIPEPYPSGKYIPKWFKNLPDKIVREGAEGPGGLHSSTAKRCMPFLDSMLAGWIIPSPADIEIQSNEDCSQVSWNSDFPKPVIETHTATQIGGQASPYHPLVPLKFINYWKIDLPKGYSALFVPPLNRSNDYFECFSGFVDTENYHDFINFPFLFFKPNWHGVIKRGTPLVQMIPIKTSTITTNSEIRAISSKELNRINKHKHRRSSQESYYREDLRKKKW